MEILINDSIPISVWQEFLSRNAHATPFQSPGFYELFNSVKDLSAQAVAVLDSGSLKALAVIAFQKESGVRGYFSDRAIIYGGPLIDDTCPVALNLLLEQISKTLKGSAIYVETRNLSDFSYHKDIFNKQGFKYIPYLNFRVDCSNYAIIWSNLNRLRKRQIKKAQLNNVIFGEAASINEVKELYNLIYYTYKHKIKKPLFKWPFFKNLFYSDYCKVFIVKSENKIIGGHFCLMWGEIIFDWYGCGLDVDYKDFAPSTMAVYAALKFGADNGYRYFDFMGAGSPGEKYGVRDFKAQFGGNLVEYGRFKLILNPIKYKIGEIGMVLLSKF